MKKILIVFGTRPEAIKMALVIRQLKEHASGIITSICITAQHRQMLDQVLKIFKIQPDYDLNIMNEDQDLFDITGKTLYGLKDVMKTERPDLVLVQGDTTTAFVAGLAAFYHRIPVGHIEAGLRTHNKYSPFPEEKNRQLLSVLVDMHFAPTEWARSNLLREGIPEEKIWVTGNTVIDALIYITEKQNTSQNQNYWEKYFKSEWNLSLPHNNDSSKLILVTGHRRENFGEGFENICTALKEIAETRKDIRIIYPVHLNPNVQQPVKTILSGCSNVSLIWPLEYEPFVFLMNRAYLIITDSGGIQEEAPSLGKPILIMRDTTERPEGIEAGTARLVGTDKDKIIKETLSLLDDSALYKKMSQCVNPYGDGMAAERIVKVLDLENMGK